jgi:hypothetical protein
MSHFEKLCRRTEATEADTVIDRLGGTGEVARICSVDPSTVSFWRRKGIPAGWSAYLRMLRPDVWKKS